MTGRGCEGGDVRSKRWRRTRSLVLLSLLLITAMVVWVQVFRGVPTIDQSVGCTPPTPGVSAVGFHDLDGVAPAPPDRVPVRMFNASSQRGAAGLMSLELADLGFPQAAEAADDPAHPLGNMSCVGQIRFGAQGAAGARTLSLLVPCAQLVRDNRPDATVDFAVGTNFNGLIVNTAARKVLGQLSTWGRQHPIPPGGLLTQDQAMPKLDTPLLTAARPGHC
ncbi:secreted alanine-rich protein [Kutzneria sp. 744]|nr:secreted alanine-rich protein [Kutzneria sp. 744]